MYLGGQFTPVDDVSSSMVASGQPSYTGEEHLTATLNLRELDDYGYGNLQNDMVGSRGYVIYDWGGPGSNLQNLPASYTVAAGSGWSDFPLLQRQFKVDNVMGSNYGLLAGQTASINIGVSDANYHYLTVFSPAQFNNHRQFTLQLNSTNNTSVMYNVYENNGLSHVYQFMFKGNVTLTAISTGTWAGGSDAIVQALFLDDAPVVSLGSLPPPANFRMIGP
jgi:hypothetical protein